MAETENAKSTGNNKMHAIILLVIGVILMIAGVGIITIHSSLEVQGLAQSHL